jgi:hypothetical protein
MNWTAVRLSKNGLSPGSVSKVPGLLLLVRIARAEGKKTAELTGSGRGSCHDGVRNPELS